MLYWSCGNALEGASGVAFCAYNGWELEALLSVLVVVWCPFPFSICQAVGAAGQATGVLRALPSYVCFRDYGVFSHNVEYTVNLFKWKQVLFYMKLLVQWSCALLLKLQWYLVIKCSFLRKDFGILRTSHWNILMFIIHNAPCIYVGTCNLIVGSILL